MKYIIAFVVSFLFAPLLIMGGMDPTQWPMWVAVVVVSVLLACALEGR